MHTYTHICTHIFIYARICAYLHAYMHICTHMCGRKALFHWSACTVRHAHAPMVRFIRHAPPLDIAVRSTFKKPSDRSPARLNKTCSSNSFWLNQSSLATAFGENLVRGTLFFEFKLLASSEFSLPGIRGTSWQSCCIWNAFEPSVFGLRLHSVGSFSNPFN